MKTMMLFLLASVTVPTISNAQLSPQVAAQLDAIEAPSLMRSLRARADVETNVRRFVAQLGLESSPRSSSAMLAQNGIPARR